MGSTAFFFSAYPQKIKAKGILPITLTTALVPEHPPEGKSWVVHDLCGVDVVGRAIRHQELGEGLEPSQDTPDALRDNGPFSWSIRAVDLMRENA